MKDILENIADELVDDIKQTMVRKNLNDTNDTSNSLRSQVNDKSIKIIANEEIEFLDRGSRPWDDPTQFKKLGFILSDKVSGWASRKADLDPYAVARKIAFEGSSIFKDKSKGIELDEIEKKGINLIKLAIGEEVKLRVLKEFNKLKEVAR